MHGFSSHLFTICEVTKGFLLQEEAPYPRTDIWRASQLYPGFFQPWQCALSSFIFTTETRIVPDEGHVLVNKCGAWLLVVFFSQYLALKKKEDQPRIAAQESEKWQIWSPFNVKIISAYLYGLEKEQWKNWRHSSFGSQVDKMITYYWKVFRYFFL